MGSQVSDVKEIREENVHFRGKFYAYVAMLAANDDLNGLMGVIEALADNLSSFTTEVIRQRLEDGKIDVNSLPKHIFGTGGEDGIQEGTKG